MPVCVCPYCGFQNPHGATRCGYCASILGPAYAAPIANIQTPRECTNCHNVYLHFEPNGFGVCLSCHREFRWDIPGNVNGDSRPPTCPICLAVALTFYPNGAVTCGNCGFISYWRKFDPSPELFENIFENLLDFRGKYAKEFKKRLQSVTHEVRKNIHEKYAPPPAGPASWPSLPHRDCRSSGSRPQPQPQPQPELQPQPQPQPPTTPIPTVPERETGAGLQKPEAGKEVEVQAEARCYFARAHLIYEVQLSNQTSVPIGDMTITPYISEDLFVLDHPHKKLTLLRPGETQSVIFTLRPKDECGSVSVSGKVRYYDTNADCYEEATVPPVAIEIICPMLQYRQIGPDEWREATAKLFHVQEIIEHISIDAMTLHEIVSEAIQGMNMAMLEPKTSGDRIVFRATAKFYSEGIKGNQYAVTTEVIGGGKRSKLILTAYADTEAALAGVYHTILDEIQKRIDIKQYINDSVIVQHISEYVEGSRTTVQDSIIQKSKLP